MLPVSIILNVTGIVGDQEAKPKSWILTSPGWPHRYSNNIRSTQTIQVPEGNTIRFAWTFDGTDLTTKLSQHYEIGESKLPPPGTSNSNIMHVKFHTDNSGRRTGWRLEWNEVDSKNDNLFLMNQKIKMEWIILKLVYRLGNKL